MMQKKKKPSVHVEGTCVRVEVGDDGGHCHCLQPSSCREEMMESVVQGGNECVRVPCPRPCPCVGGLSPGCPCPWSVLRAVARDEVQTLHPTTRALFDVEVKGRSDCPSKATDRKGFFFLSSIAHRQWTDRHNTAENTHTEAIATSDFVFRHTSAFSSLLLPPFPSSPLPSFAPFAPLARSFLFLPHLPSLLLDSGPRHQDPDDDVDSQPTNKKKGSAFAADPTLHHSPGQGSISFFSLSCILSFPSETLQP